MDEMTRVLEIRNGSIRIGADISLRSSFLYAYRDIQY